jgi:DNA-binding HxlR family transcriptional regulator
MRLPCPPNACPMDSILRLLAGPWTTYIVWILSERGNQRFGTLKRQIGGISTRMLTARLRLLEEYGVVSRHVVQTTPPQVSYELTARGRELGAALTQLNSVAVRWEAEDRDKAA